MIFIPENAQYYAAYGAVMYGLHEPQGVGVYKGLEDLKTFITHGRKAKLGEKAGAPLVKSIEELEQFRRQYSIPKFIPAAFEPGSDD
ncbi:hypothetical protein J2S21_000946 [Peribacillus cavernae]|nr:hypothetical protein [Peribacillus cavernae]